MEAVVRLIPVIIAAVALVAIFIGGPTFLWALMRAHWQASQKGRRK